MKLLFYTLCGLTAVLAVAAVVCIFASFWVGDWGTGVALFATGAFSALLSLCAGTGARVIYDEYVT